MTISYTIPAMKLNWFAFLRAFYRRSSSQTKPTVECFFNTMAKTHGLSYTAEYHAWSAMRERCFNKKSNRYKSHGGRGIRVCDEWRFNFKKFYDDMGPKPSKSHTLDRIDNNGNYCKENCRWATQKEQQNNKSNNHIITHLGHTGTISEVADALGLEYMTVYCRIARGTTRFRIKNTSSL